MSRRRSPFSRPSFGADIQLPGDYPARRQGRHAHVLCGDVAFAHAVSVPVPIPVAVLDVGHGGRAGGGGRVRKNVCGGNNVPRPKQLLTRWPSSRVVDRGPAVVSAISCHVTPPGSTRTRAPPLAASRGRRWLRMGDQCYLEPAVPAIASRARASMSDPCHAGSAVLLDTLNGHERPDAGLWQATVSGSRTQ